MHTAQRYGTFSQQAYGSPVAGWAGGACQPSGRSLGPLTSRSVAVTSRVGCRLDPFTGPPSRAQSCPVQASAAAETKALQCQCNENAGGHHSTAQGLSSQQLTAYGILW